MTKDATMINANEAIEMIKKRGVDVTRPTLLAWCKKHKGLGNQIGGRWYIDVKRLNFLLDGKTWQSEEQQ